MIKKFYLFLLSSLLFNCYVVSRRIEDSVYLSAIASDDNVRRFFNPDLEKYEKLIDYVLLNQKKKLNNDCVDSLTSIKYGLASYQDWALKCEYSFEEINKFPPKLLI